MVSATDVQRWSWKFLRVVLAVFLGVACFGVAMPRITEAVAERLPFERRLRLIEPAPLTPLRVMNADTSLVLDLHDRELTGSAHVRMSRHDLVAIQRAVAARGKGAAWHSTLEHYVPHVEVDGERIDYAGISFAVGEGATNGSMSLRLRPTRLRDELQTELEIDTYGVVERGAVDVTLLTHGRTVVARSIAPRRQSPSETIFTTEANRSISMLVLHSRGKNKREVPRRRISEVVSRFDAKYLRVVQPLVTALMYSVPFALLLGLLSRFAPHHRPVAVSLVVLFVGVGVARASLDLYFGPFAPLRQLITDTCWKLLFNPSGAAVLGAAFVAGYWPLFTRRARRGEVRSAGTHARVVLWIALVASSVAAAASGIGACSRNTAEGAAVAAAAAGAIFGLAAAAAELAPARRALFDAILLAAAATMFDLLDRLLDPSNVEAFALIALFVLPLLYSLLRLLAPRGNRRAHFAVAAVAAAIAVFGPLPDYNLWWEATISNVARALAPALRVVAAVYLIRLLRDFSRSGDWAVLEPGEREAGIVLALTFFFMPSQQWLSILVTFSLGWLLLQRWVFVPRNITAQSDVPATIRDVIRLNEAELALRMMKKDHRAKLATGELAFHEYERHVRGMEALVEELRERLQPVGNTAPAAVLSSGTPMEPWARAAIGAKYGLLFAVPWLALFLRDFHAGFAPDRGYEWSAAIGTALQAMGQWPLLGFFFGYFYPHLRGETGLSKGLYLFLAVVTPAFAATALAMPTSTPAWTSFSFWALQLFIHCMLLGLFAGDHETLRASGLGWRHLVDVHNLGALAAWGSSLLLAVGVAATTAATTQVGALVMQALQNVVPELRR